MKTIVLFSGGLDSTVALGWSIKTFGKENVEGLFFDYGQSHLEKEWEAAFLIADKLGIPLDDTYIPFAKRFGMGDLVSKNIYKESEVSTAFLPLRNPLFLTIACMKAISNEMDSLVVGYTKEDYDGFPDCRLEFLNSFHNMLINALGKDIISIYYPLITFTKEQTIELGRELDMKEYMKISWSCYKGGEIPCGECDACKVRIKGGL